MNVFVTLGDEQLQNLTDFYLDHRDFMTEQERLVCEMVIQRKSMRVEESYIITRLHKELKNLD